MLQYFTDPVLRAPTIGSMLMCVASALVGVMVFLRRRSLLGEALSHAAYPGVVISVIVVASLFPSSDHILAVAILVGAFISGVAGLWAIDLLEKRFKVKNDAALCFVLSVFFGIGILIASRIQITHALWYKQIQVFLYGQAATMTDVHMGIYGALAFIIAVMIVLSYRLIELIHFDREYATSLGVKTRVIDALIFLLLVLAIVVGIRSVGVVLMSGMLIAPAVAARQHTNRLWLVFLLAAFFGLASGFFGNYLSVELPQFFSLKFSLPTGPMILLVASAICLFSLFFAKENGVIPRYMRIVSFRNQCLQENILKMLWKRGALTFKEIAHLQQIKPFALANLLRKLRREGWIEKKVTYILTREGMQKAARIIRLHRLWEVYLVYLGQNRDKVHRNAEEMEHIITPELE